MRNRRILLIYRGIDRRIMSRTIARAILSHQQHNVCLSRIVDIGALSRAAEHGYERQGTRPFGLHQAHEAVGSNSSAKRHFLW